MAEFRTLASAARPTVEVNRVLRNTYLLLAFTVAFACVTGTVAAALNVWIIGGLPGLIIYLGGFFGLSYLVNRTAHSVWGLFWTFMFTGFIGFVAGPIVGYYLAVHPGVVAQALGVTAGTFFGLSLYTIVTKKDFSFLRSFLVVGFWVLIGIIVCSIFFDLSAFSAAISAIFVLFACALMLYKTSEIVLGGETNYIIATNDLFVSIYLLFMSLLHLFGIMGDD